MSVPRIDLHCHLDGSMRLTTIEQLAADAGLSYDAPIAEIATVGPDCHSLVEFLGAIDVQVDVLQTPDALERAAVELVEDFHADGVVHGEIRFAPHLHRRHGADLDRIIDAVACGATEAAERLGISTSIILCALRHRDPTEGRDLIEAIDRLPGRVDGVDLAGPEAGFPPDPFGDYFAAAAARKLGITIHAGEADGPASVRRALALGAERIGHGVRSVGDPDLVADLADRGTVLECCPTCNALTKAVPSLAEHPIDRLHRAGVAVTVSTDCRTSIPTTLTAEMEALRHAKGWDDEREVVAQLAAADGAFVDSARREELRRLIQR